MKEIDTSALFQLILFTTFLIFVIYSSLDTDVEKICINEVVYYRMFDSITPALNKNSTVMICEGDE